VINEAGGDRAARHALHGSGVALGLRQGKATELLDSLDAIRAVAADTCKHDADSALAAFVGK
jgi:hypothetical protein